MQHSANTDLNIRPEYDQVIQDIVDYVFDYKTETPETFETARHCLMDTLGCGILALSFPACTKLMGPIVAGTVVPMGVRVPGTNYRMDPVKAAFDIGAMIRWLDYNDTWLAAEWGHPSDSLGAILAVADYVSQQSEARGMAGLTMKDVLTAMIQAHEIQGCLALENSFNRAGLDHVLLVKVASTAVVTKMMGGTREQTLDAVSHAWLDGQSLRTYRHAPNAGSRKSWAAGDATSRAVRLSMMVLDGEMGYPSALTAKTWGFYDVLFKGQEFKFQRPYGHYVMDNILFKISYPAEYHAQTAVECAVALHDEVKDRLDDIEKIVLTTHEAALRIISKSGALHNPADRDHCLQYMVAVPLMTGGLIAENYEDDYAATPMIDALREKMVVEEDLGYSKDYHDPEKRAFTNAIEVHFKDGSKTACTEVEFPIGHPSRRKEGIPLLEAKFKNNLETHYSAADSQKLIKLCDDQTALEATPVTTFMGMMVKSD